MKRLIVLSFTFLIVSTNVFSQCEPQTSVTNIYEPVGFIPLPTDGKLSPSQFFCYPGQPFDAILTALAPQTFIIDNPLGFPPTIEVDVNWIRLTDIQNLPSWVSYSCGGQLDPTDPCKMAFPTWSCVRAYSNEADGKVPMTEVPGTTYSLDVIVDADVSPLGTQSNFNGGSITLFIRENMSLSIEVDSCNGGQAIANAQGGFGDAAAYTYEWSNGNDLQIVEGLTTGWLKCTVTDQVTGWSAIDSVFVESVVAPIVISNEQITQPTNNNGSISLTASGGQGTLTFGWTGPNGFVANTASITNLSGGQYTLTITDAYGCSKVKIYNLSTASIEDFEYSTLSIYPNPASTFLTIKHANAAQALRVELFTLDGKLVRNELLTAIDSNYKLDVSNVLSGKYLIRIISGNQVMTRSISIN
ncbi:MAG: hypothetical protein RL264_1902 [Bacteroidota bacterium]|jgi:hypothetical protein